MKFVIFNAASQNILLPIFMANFCETIKSSASILYGQAWRWVKHSVYATFYGPNFGLFIPDSIATFRGL